MYNSMHRNIKLGIINVKNKFSDSFNFLCNTAQKVSEIIFLFFCSYLLCTDKYILYIINVA